MKILMINVVCGIRSTGRICTDLSEVLEARGHEVKIAYGREKVPVHYQKYAVHIGNDLDVKIHGLKARLVDGCGFGSRYATERFIKWVKEYNPDVIHLHNLHGYYINVEVLFRYLKTCGKKIIWTLHDCWAFTGHCTYFDYVGCNKWRKYCKKCVQKKEYPSSFWLDRSKQNFYIKKKIFTSLKNITIITPSEWLANLVRQSYLSEYTVKVIHNGIDLETFKPTESNLREKYNLNNKIVILGVASDWSRRKGLEYFIQLSKLISDKFRIVLVGVTKDQIVNLPSQIIGIDKTNSTQELAAFYSMSDVFVNPTLEDNYPTTNLEAIACGIPVVSFDTGGSTESAKLYGIASSKGNVKELLNAIEKALNLKMTNSRDLLSYKYMSQLYLEEYER